MYICKAIGKNALHLFTFIFPSLQPVFLTALANELSNVGKSDVARMAAGLQLKNYLTSKAVEVKVHLQQTWLTMDIAVRQHIKVAVSSSSMYV